MICDVMLVCVEVRNVILIKELAQGADRRRSPITIERLLKFGSETLTLIMKAFSALKNGGLRL